MDPDNPSDLRALLAQVAAGQVAPEEASQLISGPAAAAAPTGGAAPSEPRSPLTAPPSDATTGAPIDRVVVRASAVKLVLLGDPTVAGASVEGPHVARRDGGTLVIDTDAKPGFGDFSFESSARRVGKAFGRWRGGETVLVKVRPEVPVEVTIQAGSIVATRLQGGLRFVVEAGALKAMDCAGPLDGRVEAGSAQLDWLLDRGNSRLRCELGSIKVRLDSRSDVLVRARAELGSVDLGRGATYGADSARELRLGNGAATLDIDVELGSAKVAVGA